MGGILQALFYEILIVSINYWGSTEQQDIFL